MAIITLTTDWHKSDYYIGVLKGKILSGNPKTNIVDISHQIQPFNIMQAAFILRNCWFEFPDGTVHLICIQSILSDQQKLLVIQKKEQYFLTSDNGIAGLLFGEDPDHVFIADDMEMKDVSFTIDVFVRNALQLCSGKKPGDFCKSYKDYKVQIPLRPAIDKNLINGSVIYIDSFYNAITNISRETFEKVGEGKPFEILIQSNHYKINKLNQTYADSTSGELLALFNSVGLLEIAINHGTASELLNLTINSTIRIKFYDKLPDSELRLTGT